MTRRFLVVLLLSGLLSGGPLAAQRTIYIVRHAEKVVKPGERNPELSRAGKERAQALARALRSVKLDHCFATQFRRTQDTVQPAAKAAGLDIERYAAGRESKFVKTLLAEVKGKNILVAGHSNTVPALLKHLGLEKKVRLDDGDYDDLFIVRLDGNNRPTLLHLHYGAPNPDAPKTKSPSQR